jgi:hypothetical protein
MAMKSENFTHTHTHTHRFTDPKQDIILFYFFFVGLEFELRGLYLPSRCSTA